LGLEVDNVYTFIDDYNDGQNGYVDYPVVLDPEGTDINLGYIKYSTSDMRFVLGRQRIEHENQRFIGGSGWRQNEQTYDGFRAQFKNSSFELDYSFINNINSVTDDDIKGDFHLANLSFDLNKSSKLSVYAYLLDFENNISASTSTYGVHYQGKFGQVMFNARAASQSDYADNVTDYSAKYLNAEIGYHFKKSELVILGGYEVLGSDEGNSFQTPLATNHNFQGWSDQFLVTPNEGVQDIYITIKGKIGKATLEATYHDFVEDLNDKDLGSEVNGLISYEINKNYRFLIKYAAYNAGSVTFNKVDTKKTWVEFHAYF
jgi:hypothetical protein